ncbi:Rhodanese-related sulfurtransferase [Klebsiella grimontii]|uniref:Rhodanese-related sulfurtransferase n=1 Tax=Klebsiella grimontii TaxID=2058152 RepID=A0A7H4P285_9ENTR|nr:Rhodanese-related sulfurtransferase [Klebsiella grimontii]
MAALTGKPVRLLSGGTLAWIDAGLALEHGETHLATPRSDRYQRPYEGTDNSPAAMQAYLDWEFGLVEQLKRDGTHGFTVL